FFVYERPVCDDTNAGIRNPVAQGLYRMAKRILIQQWFASENFNMVNFAICAKFDEPVYNPMAGHRVGLIVIASILKAVLAPEITVGREEYIDALDFH
ncbi:MAG: hypothetical protein MUO52_00845, partial [Desulfobacterales bacterium]|nr:hypothetical protein [Desulfobacterales bacterium]